MTNETEFSKELYKRIRAKITELRADGTVAASEACLCQLVRPPSHTLAGAPAWPVQYRALFAHVVASVPSFRNFTNI